MSLANIWKNVGDNEPFKQLFFADNRLDNEITKKRGKVNYNITHVFPILKQGSSYNVQLIDLSNKNVIFAFVSGDTTSLPRNRMFNRYGFPLDYDLKNYNSMKMKGDLSQNRIAVRIRKTIIWEE